MASRTTDLVQRFFSHLTARDWDELSTILDHEILRIGPFGDGLSGRQVYLDFLRAAVPPDYGNDVRRIIATPDGRFAFATVTEHLRYEEEEFHLDEAYSFEIGENGLITRIEIYWQTPHNDPGGFGSAASNERGAFDTSADRDSFPTRDASR